MRQISRSTERISSCKNFLYFSVIVPQSLFRKQDGIQNIIHSSTTDLSLVMAALCNRADHYIFALWFLSLSFFLMAALWNMAGHYIFVLSFLSFFFFS